MYLNAVAGDFLIPRVQLGFECAVGDDAAIGLQQNLQNVELLARQVNQFAIALHGVPLNIHA